MNTHTDCSISRNNLKKEAVHFCGRGPDNHSLVYAARTGFADEILGERNNQAVLHVTCVSIAYRRLASELEPLGGATLPPQ